MRVFGLLACFLSFSVWAETRLITTQIYDIDYGTKSDDDVLVLLTSGDVAKLSRSDLHLLPDNNKSFVNDGWYEIKMDRNRYITKAKRVAEPEPSSLKALLNEPTEYVPTTVESMEVAKKYHKEARLYAKDSQCFNRAMVWSYEWWKKHSLKSNKILIYWTRTYIRRYNFQWWFHIAPLLNVMDNGKVVERVMDIKYTRGPLSIQKWTDIFMRNDAVCQVISKYSEYADYPYTGDCYIQRTNMYVLQPADLQMEEAWGYKKTNFIMDEVRASYLEAFDERI